MYSVLNELRCQVNKPCLNQLVGRTSLASAPQLTSRLETDSSAHLDKRSEQHLLSSNSWFILHIPKALHRCFRKQHGHVFCLQSEKACLYASADWLSPSVSQRVARGPLSKSSDVWTDSDPMPWQRVLIPLFVVSSMMQNTAGSRVAWFPVLNASLHVTTFQFVILEV